MTSRVGDALSPKSILAYLRERVIEAEAAAQLNEVADCLRLVQSGGQWLQMWRDHGCARRSRGEVVARLHAKHLVDLMAREGRLARRPEMYVTYLLSRELL